MTDPANVEPEEISTCEDCGASLEFCTCPYGEPEDPNADV